MFRKYTHKQPCTNSRAYTQTTMHERAHTHTQKEAVRDITTSIADDTNTFSTNSTNSVPEMFGKLQRQAMAIKKILGLRFTYADCRLPPSSLSAAKDRNYRRGENFPVGRNNSISCFNAFSWHNDYHHNEISHFFHKALYILVVPFFSLKLIFF